MLTAMAKVDADRHAAAARDKAMACASQALGGWVQKAVEKKAQLTAFQEYGKRYLEEDDENPSGIQLTSQK